MNKTILIAILAWFAATSVVAQLNDSTDPAAAGFSPQRLARIDNAINAEISSGNIPGAVALIARNGAIVYQKSFGFADIDTQKPMQTSNIFRLASMTKAVTAVDDDGNLTTADATRPIRIIDLLTHTSGIDRDGAADFGLGFYITELKNAGELGSSGSYSWGGAFNTTFWIDPTEKIIAVYMGQTRPVQSDIKKRFQTLVYQALE